MNTRLMLSCLLLAITAAPLAACGLKPVYGTHAGQNAVASNLNSVYISPIPDRLGQDLRNQLTDMFYRTGRPGENARYRLQVTSLRERELRLGIAKDASTTRAQIRITANITLYDTATGDRVFTRNLRAASSFNNLPSQYTTLVSENNARAGATRDLAKQITTALELYFSNPAAFDALQTLPPAGQIEQQAEDNNLIDESFLDHTR